MCMTKSLFFSFFPSFSSNDQMTLIFQGIWINTTLLYVGLSIVSITINLCANGVAKQMQKTGKYIKILAYFQDQDSQEAKTTQQTDSAQTTRRRQDPEHFEMEKLEDQPENEQSGVSVDSKLNAVDANKRYGTVED